MEMRKKVVKRVRTWKKVDVHPLDTRPLRTWDSSVAEQKVRILNGCEVRIKNSVTRVTDRHHETWRDRSFNLNCLEKLLDAFKTFLQQKFNTKWQHLHNV